MLSGGKDSSFDMVKFHVHTVIAVTYFFLFIVLANKLIVLIIHLVP